MNISLVLNGRPMTLTIEPDVPLLWAIRESAGLTGTKFGCGVAQCGACTVHVDGRPTLSCVTPVADVDGRDVTTIEGVADEAAEAVRTAWLALDVAECGYCQPGQIMAAIALLEQTPNPTDADIDGAMRGNICRCGIYHRIRTAIHQAASSRGN